MKIKTFLMASATCGAIAFCLSNIAANCKPPSPATVITVEGWVCAIAEMIPPISGYAQYLCTVIGQNGKPSAAEVVKVPVDQVSSFEKAHKIVAPAEMTKLLGPAAK